MAKKTAKKTAKKEAKAKGQAVPMVPTTICLKFGRMTFTAWLDPEGQSAASCGGDRPTRHGSKG